MLAIFDKVLDLAGFYDEDENSVEEEYETEEEEDVEVNNKRYRTVNEKLRDSGNSTHSNNNNNNNKHSNNVVSFNGQNPNNSVVLSKPESYDDAQTICDHLKDRQTVVVNLEEINNAELAQRIVDFVSGSVFALDGEIRKVSKEIFVVAPNNVMLVPSKSEFKSRGFYPYANGNGR